VLALRMRPSLPLVVGRASGNGGGRARVGVGGTPAPRHRVVGRCVVDAGGDCAQLEVRVVARGERGAAISNRRILVRRWQTDDGQLAVRSCGPPAWDLSQGWT
jgi:hypothetical protein